MTSRERNIFYEVIDNLVEYIILHSKMVCKNQSVFSDFLNETGVFLFYKKMYPVSKAMFWVAFQLGNRFAFRNYLCI